MRRCLLLTLCLCLLLSAALGESANTVEEDIDALLRRSTAGAIIVVAKDGEIVLEHAFGYANKKEQIPITPDHYFNIASVTKFVTSFGMMQLVESGDIGLDAPIGDALGFEVKNYYYPNTPVTLRHLMTHTSALRNQGGFSKSKSRLDQFLPAELKRSSEWRKRPSGSKYEYSNYGAGLMGSMIEQVTGKNINDYMKEVVFDPLGMDAGYDATLLSDPSLVTSRYRPNGNIQVSTRAALEDSNWDPGVDPYGHFHITVGSMWIRGRDLCRLGMLLLNGGELDGVRLLQPETIEEMMSSQLGKPNITVDSPYGLCVVREDSLTRDRRIFYGHQGVYGGAVANVYADPETNFVFTFISNGAKTGLNDRVVALSRRVFAVCWAAYGDPSTEAISR